MIKFKALFIFSFFTLSLLAQSGLERYSTIGLSIDDFHKLVADPSHGLAIDHFHKNEDKLFEFVFNQNEIQLLKERGINYQIIIEDYKSHFRDLIKGSSERKSFDCGLENFDTGEMGGYHTYSEMVSHIHSMDSLFSDLVDIDIIGESHEGRSIWSVKISDNPKIDESNDEGVVYYEAITHAREPMSLEATLYYMWWLLENYSTNEEANYLINNREIYFVPIVNPDGYVYNETTDPTGGGLWRKNRYNAGDGCYGVDLNRNYPKGWGLDSGSSNSPCSQTYRGETPFSEPESSAIRDFVGLINPSIAFSSHTYGDKFLSPWGYVDSLASYELYAEFVSEFIPKTYDGYGTTAKMLNYTSSGTTRDYLHTQNVLTWVPEIGHSFWESPDVICDRVLEFLKPMKYLSWVSGEYVCFHDFTVKSPNVWLGETIALDIRLKNRGLTQTALDTRVEISSSHPAVVIVNGVVEYGSIPARAFQESEDAPFSFELTELIPPSERLPFTVQVFMGNTLSYSKEIYITVGEERILYLNDFESDNSWISTSMDWDTSFMDATSGFHSFTDSRFGNYLANSSTFVYLDEPVDLSATNFPIVSFNAKWALEPAFDYVTFFVSTNGINNWIPIQGLYTNDNSRYDQNSHWIQEQFNLTPFIGEPNIYFAFQLDSDSGVHSDGFYIDDFKVSDYFEPIFYQVNEQKSELSQLRLVPNPALNESTLFLTAPKTILSNIQILGLNGRLISQKLITLISGNNKIHLDLSELTAGIYLVKLSSEIGISYLKLVVRD